MVAYPDSVNHDSPEQLTVTTICGLSIDNLVLNVDVDKIKDISNHGLVESLSTGTLTDSVFTIESVPKTSSDTLSVTDGKLSSLKKERWYYIALQVAIPFLLAGFGTIGAGIVLGKVQFYPVFQDVGSLFILVPTILGLKGNLDTCLASRLSTQANLGNMVGRKEILSMVIGNVALVQVQAIVAAFLVSLFAVGVGALTQGEKLMIEDAILLCTSSVLTATSSCFILDFLLIGVIFLSHKLHMNPDNLATPFGASVGDVVSLVLLSTIANYLHKIHETHTWILLTIISTYLFILLPLWILVVRRNDYTKKILTSGWIPVLSALIISGFGGLVLDSAVEQYRGFVLFQPIINGIGGNLVSVQASRIATMLHQTALIGIIPDHSKQWVSPWKALINGVPSAQSARILICLQIPGQIIFAYVADSVYNGEPRVGPIFVLTYVLCSTFQVVLLLYTAHILIHTMWRFKIDPDNASIPYLTALGDLSGSSILFLAFLFLKSIHQEYEPLIDGI